MARALGIGLTRAKAGFELAAYDPEPTQRARFRAETGGAETADNPSLVAQSEVVVLAVKPQVMGEALRSIASAVRPEHLIISIAAGIGLRTIEAALGATTRVVRVLPNTPALIGRGMSVMVGGRSATAADLATTERLFAAVGEVARIDDEGLMDAVTAVSGSGPGFIFAFAEALAEA